jgi:hypothetical protein
MRIELPSQIGKLQQLEILDISAPDIKLPFDIGSLPLLLHLHVHENTVFPNGIGRLRLLRTLRYFDLGKNSVESIEGLGDITSLSEFYFSCKGKDLVEGARRMDVLRSCLERITDSLRFLCMPWQHQIMDGWSTFSPPPIHLRDMLMWGCVFSTIPKWFGHLRDLQSLGLVIRGAGLKDDGVAILAGLPSLVYLNLETKDPLEERVHIPGSGMAFRAVKQFRLWCEHLLLTFEAGAMPMLEELSLKLSLSSCESGWSVEVPVDGIEHLPASLVDIMISIDRKIDQHKKEAMESSLKIAFEEHHPGAALRFL